MTTIVYDHKAKMIACDTRSTNGFGICTDNAMKWISGGGWILFSAGAICENSLWPKILDEARYLTEEHMFDNIGFLVEGGSVYLVCVEEAGNGFTYLRKHKLECSEGIGSGGMFARCALDFGKTAKQAVKYAMQKDQHSGGKVVLFDVERECFV